MAACESAATETASVTSTAKRVLLPERLAMGNVNINPVQPCSTPTACPGVAVCPRSGPGACGQASRGSISPRQEASRWHTMLAKRGVGRENNTGDIPRRTVRHPSANIDLGFRRVPSPAWARGRSRPMSRRMA